MANMCNIPFLSTKKLKETFTTPRSATGFVIRPDPPSSEAMREHDWQRRTGAWTQTPHARDRGIEEWKADIERLDREARSSCTASESDTECGRGATSIAGIGV